MKITVIIPVYNVADYIERCISSVMRQSYQMIECIIIDDATKDDSILICERLIENYQGTIKFQILHHQINRGLSAARNTGTMAAKGDYLLYLDGDDELADNCLELLLEGVEKYPGINLVQGNAASTSNKRLDPYAHQIYEPYLSTNEKIREYWFGRKQFGLTAWNKLVRRDFVMEHSLFFVKGLLFEDALWNFYLQKYLTSVYFVQDVTYYYHRRQGSIQTGTDKQAVGRHYSYILCNILNNLTSGKEKEELKYYSRTLALLYPKCVDAYPKMHIVWSLFWDASTRYHVRYIRLWLLASRLISGIKFGQLALPFIRNIINTAWNLQYYMSFNTLKLAYKWKRLKY